MLFNVKGENMKQYLFIFGVLLALVFSGCGSDSNDDTSTPSSQVPDSAEDDNTASENGNTQDEVLVAAYELAGTVAVGEALQANISVVGANGLERMTQSAEDGTYRVYIEGLTAPYIVRASTEDGIVLFSFAQEDGVIANVTPLTSYILDQVATAASLSGVSQLYSEFEEQYSALNGVEPAITQLNSALETYMREGGVENFDHFRESFDADHTGYDALLDTLDIEIENDDMIIRLDNMVLETLDDVYDLDNNITTLSGYVMNPFDETPIAGATLEFVSSNGETFYITTTQTGAFTLDLPRYRTYTLTASAGEYTTVIRNNVSTFALGDVSIGTVEMIPQSMSGDGDVLGRIIDARTGTGLENVTLSFRTNVNNRVGEVVATTTTDANGEYIISLPVGVYTVGATLNGYSTNYRTVYSYGSSAQYIAPALSIFSTSSEYNNTNAFATIQLSWGANPEDLDSHLTGPDMSLAGEYASGDRFHITWFEQIHANGNYTGYESDYDPSNPCENGNIIAALDLDDVQSYGPETTTICRVESGTYSFYVHHYEGSSSITASPATVTITTASGISRTYTAPAGATGSSDDVWHVFNISSNGNITPINSYISGEENIRSVSHPRDERFRQDYDLLVNLPEK